MSTVVVTTALVFSDADPTQPCARVFQAAGGIYRVDALDGSRESVEHPNYDAAVADALFVAGEVAKDPRQFTGLIELRKAQADLVVKDAEIADLRAQLAAKGVEVVEGLSG